MLQFGRDRQMKTFLLRILKQVNKTTNRKQPEYIFSLVLARVQINTYLA